MDAEGIAWASIEFVLYHLQHYENNESNMIVVLH